MEGWLFSAFVVVDLLTLNVSLIVLSTSLEEVTSNSDIGVDLYGISEVFNVQSDF